MQWGHYAPAPVVVKDATFAYLFAVFLGQFGAHQFYLRNLGLGVGQLILGLLGWGTAWLVIGWFLLIPLWCWVVVDLFLIPGWVRKANGLTR